jgi:hypothetical protein
MCRDAGQEPFLSLPEGGLAIPPQTWFQAHWVYLTTYEPMYEFLDLQEDHQGLTIHKLVGLKFELNTDRCGLSGDEQAEEDRILLK